MQKKYGFTGPADDGVQTGAVCRTREPVSLSEVVAALASTAGGRNGRELTVGTSVMSRVCGQEGEQRPGVVERCLVRVVLGGEKVEAETVDG
ncbi:hypothetical protein [Streptomyces sp. NPDC058291]|uniref:hypothetical protein n=1 Tax=Streptomyces sp. NPDC058291 TaxID=3346427 RepID=UPI0036F03131